MHEGLIEAEVVVVEPLGSHNLLTVRSGEDMLKVSTSPRLFPEPDSAVWLRLEPNRIRWMDPETGSALEPAAAVPQSVTRGELRRSAGVSGVGR